MSQKLRESVHTVDSNRFLKISDLIHHKNNRMKIFFSIVVLLIIPFVVNCICSIPSCHVGNANDWIGFWGAYIGSIISVFGSMYIFKKTFENDKNVREKEYEKEKVKRLYDEKRKEIEFIEEDLCGRLSRLHLEVFSDLSISISEEPHTELTPVQKKQLLSFYYKLITDKTTFGLRYARFNGDSAKEFKDFYLQCIESIIKTINFTVFGSVCKKVDKLDVGLMCKAGLEEDEIKKGFEIAQKWIKEEREKLNNENGMINF